MRDGFVVIIDFLNFMRLPRNTAVIVTALSAAKQP